ncbi:MAG: hypothetical protein LC739_02680 [Actinobacteria bacterium]|nr:hypothetical protein [Actinomycetota bacterium]
MGLAAFLIGVLLIIAALVIWQHAPRPTTTPVYGVEDAVGFVLERLPAPVSVRLGEAGVRRILEWEVFYLQGLAQDHRSQAVETVAGPYLPAVEYIGQQIEAFLGKTYSPADIEGVLELEVLYLNAIGAIGDPAEES